MRKYGRSKDFEAMKAGKLAIWPKSQFLFHKNLPPRDFSIMTLRTCNPRDNYMHFTGYGLRHRDPRTFYGEKFCSVGS